VKTPFTTPPPPLTRFLKQALLMLGTPYLWGGRGPRGADCWGMIAYAYKAAGGADLCEWNTRSAWVELPEAKEPSPGAVACFGHRDDGSANHVMLCLPLGMMIGATGGDKTVTNTIEAYRRRAQVTLWEPHEYPRLAKDFRGYRLLPFKEPAGHERT
jgi:cell wall-associated NlpC family hydrolase